MKSAASLAKAGNGLSIHALIGAGVLLLAAAATSQEARAREHVDSGSGYYHLSDVQSVVVPVVAFLSDAPVIDGVLDQGLERLATGSFSEVLVDGRGPESEAADHQMVTAAIPTYRLAYGTDFFYLYIEAPGDRMQFRDRAYQNGDGFSLMLGSARPDDAATDEFYVLSCSAVDDRRMEWTRRIFWYYNVDDIFVGTSDETRLEFRATGGKISFELLLPWHDVHPYHPWISKGLGFNLRFVKAVGEGARYKYIVVPDEIGAEYQNRLYRVLEFDGPRVEGLPQTFVRLNRGNIRHGERLKAVAVTAGGGAGEEELEVRIPTGLLGSRRLVRTKYVCHAGLTRNEFELETSGLKVGEHEIKWSSTQGSSNGDCELTVLPEFDFDAMDMRLTALTGELGSGSITTLEWYVENLRESMDDIRPYETCEQERETLSRTLDTILAAEGGEDPYTNRVGFFRRAYRSELDRSLQPYTVIIPDKLDRAKLYPLIVFLHGSASDETNLGGFRDLVPDGCIGLGPRGRGPSNLYCFDHAQMDIVEAIEDVVESYPIDARRIVLTGFSMGGYGVYRTFYETPEKFRALAILSGKPFSSNRYAGVSAAELPAGAVPVLDFRRKENLRPFERVPVFIHHGEHDRNCSYETMVEQVDLLRTAGAHVEFVSDPKLGHEAPSQKTYRKYHDWLASVLEGNRDSDE